MRFQLGTEKIYDLADLDKVSLRDILLLEQQSTALGRPIRWVDVQAWSEQLEALSDDAARQEHPDSIWLTAVTIWASRRIAGDPVTWEQAIDFPMRDLVFIEDATDKATAKANPTKRPARKASGPAAKARAARPA